MDQICQLAYGDSKIGNGGSCMEIVSDVTRDIRQKFESLLCVTRVKAYVSRQFLGKLIISEVL